MRSDADDDDTTEFTELLDWTGHDGDMISRGDETLYVSGDWHEGVVLYDLTDPTDPHPIDQYATADGASAVRPNDTVAGTATRRCPGPRRTTIRVISSWRPIRSPASIHSS